MSEVALAKKAVLTSLLNTWSKGPSLADLLTDLGPVTRGGDSVDIPSDDTGPTGHYTETADPETVAMNRQQLIVNTPVFVNRKLSRTQMAQLLNGNYANELVRSDVGNFRNLVDDEVLTRMLDSITAAYSSNLALADLTKNMLSVAEGKVLSVPGVQESDLLWLLSPAFAAQMDPLYPNITPLSIAQAYDRGVPTARTVNGIPLFRHMGVPGFNARQVAIASSSITGNVLTMVLSRADHGFVVGQRIITSGLTNNIATAAAITGVSGTSVTAALTHADVGSNGAGFIKTASAIGICFARSRGFFASDSLVPSSDILKLTGDAGYTHQLFENIGVAFKAGAAVVVHAAIPTL